MFFDCLLEVCISVTGPLVVPETICPQGIGRTCLGFFCLGLGFI